MTVYPKHTPIAAITHFDRSTKVHFECMIHEGSKWMSKQPSCSQWFASWGNTEDCDCSMDDLRNWWTSEEYDDGQSRQKVINLGIGHRN